MSARRPTARAPGGTEQLVLPTPATAPKERETTKRGGRPRAPEEAAKDYIRRRAKPSVGPGHVKLAFTFDMPRELADRLSATAIREGVNMEAVILEILGKNVRK